MFLRSGRSSLREGSSGLGAVAISYLSVNAFTNRAPNVGDCGCVNSQGVPTLFGARRGVHGHQPR